MTKLMIRPQYTLFVFILLITAANSTLFKKLFENKQPERNVPCFFIFGDSLADPGNNNNLITSNKVNYHPYGIDYPDGPTGRFTNGKTAVDVVGEHLGFKKPIPSFLTANGSELLDGVNYASGASGILDQTGKHAGDNVEMKKQLQHHEDTISRIKEIFKNNKTATEEHLNKCLYFISTGNNDYINNYFTDGYNTSTLYTPSEYACFLTNHIAKQLKKLHKLGARKIAVNAVSSIGCTPEATKHYQRKGTICVDKLNDAAKLYNRRLSVVLLRLRGKLSGARFVQMGSLGYEPRIVIPGINNVTLSSCCPTNENGLCVPNQQVCKNRSFAPFWDGFHPTEGVNKFIGTVTYHLLKATILK